MTHMDRTTDRRAFRARLRRFIRRANALLLTAMLLAAVLLAGLGQGTANAGTWRNCRPTWGGQRCIGENGRLWVVCNPGWKPNPQSLTCSAVQP